MHDIALLRYLAYSGKDIEPVDYILRESRVTDLHIECIRQIHVVVEIIKDG